MTVRKPWCPDRRDMIWINCNPQAGREMKNMHPLVVLSPKEFNERSVIFSAISRSHSTGGREAQSPIPGRGCLKSRICWPAKHLIRSSI